MISYLKKNKYLAVGILLGMAGGFLYWKLVGCSTGSCTITSVWYNSTAYGAIMGGLAGSLFQSDKKKEEEK